MTTHNITLTSAAPDNSKQQARDHLAQLITQLPDGYLRDILQTEAPDFLRAINDDVCFIDYARQIAAQREHEAQLKANAAALTAARNELAAKQREIAQAERRLSDIEDTRREMRNLLKAV